MKVAQQLVKSFSRTAGRNATRVSRLRFKPGVVKARNGRLLPRGQVAKLGRVRIPRPTSLHVIRQPPLKGSDVAKNVVKNADIDLVLYDSQGHAIIYASQTENAIIYKAAQRTYQQKAVTIVDDIYKAVNKSKITTDAELKQVIDLTLKQSLEQATRPYVFDVSTGTLTVNVEFASGSQIVGSLNVYNTVKKGIAVGAGGYFLAKRA